MPVGRRRVGQRGDLHRCRCQSATGRLFKLMAEKQASDIFISCGAPINIKVNGVVEPVST